MVLQVVGHFQGSQGAYDRTSRIVGYQQMASCRMIWSWSSRCSNTYWHVKKNAPMASVRKETDYAYLCCVCVLAYFTTQKFLKLYQARNDFIFSHFNHYPHQTVTSLIFKLHLTNEYSEVWSHGRWSTLRWSINHYSIASDRSSTRMRWWHRICYMAHVCTSLSCHHTLYCTQRILSHCVHWYVPVRTIRGNEYIDRA